MKILDLKEKKLDKKYVKIEVEGENYFIYICNNTIRNIYKITDTGNVDVGNLQFTKLVGMSKKAFMEELENFKLFDMEDSLYYIQEANDVLPWRLSEWEEDKDLEALKEILEFGKNLTSIFDNFDKYLSLEEIACILNISETAYNKALLSEIEEDKTFKCDVLLDENTNKNAPKYKYPLYWAKEFYTLGAVLGDKFFD